MTTKGTPTKEIYCEECQEMHPVDFEELERILDAKRESDAESDALEIEDEVTYGLRRCTRKGNDHGGG